MVTFVCVIVKAMEENVHLREEFFVVKEMRGASRKGALVGRGVHVEAE